MNDRSHPDRPDDLADGSDDFGGVDERLGLVLASIGDHLDVGDTELAERRTETPPENVRSTRLAFRSVRGGWGRAGVAAAAAAVVLVVGVAVVVVVAPVREAVAGWLGIGSTRIETAPPADLAGLGVVGDSVEPIDAAGAARRGVDVTASDDTPLGRHDWVGVPPEGGVLIGWEEGGTTLWIRTPEEASPTMKQATSGRDVIEIDGLGDAAVLITGDHLLTTSHRKVAAGTVLLWSDDGVDHRLESDLDVEVMLAQAHASAGYVDSSG